MLTPYYSRLARRGGVKRISAAIYTETRLVLKTRLEQVSVPSSISFRSQRDQFIYANPTRF